MRLMHYYCKVNCTWMLKTDYTYTLYIYIYIAHVLKIRRLFLLFSLPLHRKPGYASGSCVCLHFLLGRNWECFRSYVVFRKWFGLLLLRCWCGFCWSGDVGFCIRGSSVCYSGLLSNTGFW